MKKKVIYVGPFRSPNNDAASARVLNNSKLFQNLDYDVLILSWGGFYRDEDLFEDGNYYYNGIQYIITNDIDLKGFFKRLFFLIFTGHKSLSYIKKHLTSTCYIIGYNLPLYFTLRMIIISKFQKVTFISDLTEWYNGEMFPGGKFFFPAIFNKINMSFIQKFIKNKILISSYLSKYYTNSNNIIIPALIDINNLKWLPTNDRLIDDDCVRFLYVGIPSSPNDIKDDLETLLDYFIPFFESNAKIIVNIVGVAHQDIRCYKNYNKFTTYDAKLFFHGKVSSDIVPKFFFDSDFSIIYRLNSRKSMAGFPTKLSESFAASCPVIASNVSDISSYCEDGFNGFVLQDNSSVEFEKVIHEILKKSRAEIEIYKKNAFNTAEIKLHYLSYIEKLSFYLNSST